MTRFRIPAVSVFLLFLFNFAFAGGAGGAGGMSEEQMREMMQNLEKMQECFQNIDQSAFENLKHEGEKVGNEIRELCKSGKRDEAQSRAVEYGKRVSQSEEMQAVRKCSAMAEGMMDHMPKMMQESMEEKDGHICDDI